MSEDTTRKLNERPFEERIFEELRAINMRLTTLEENFTVLDQKVGALDQKVGALDQKLEALDQRVEALDEKVDRRLMETRPIWQAVQSSLEDIGGQMGELSVDMLQMRSRVLRLEDRARTPAG